MKSSWTQRAGSILARGPIDDAYRMDDMTGAGLGDLQSRFHDDGFSGRPGDRCPGPNLYRFERARILY